MSRAKSHRRGFQCRHRQAAKLGDQTLMTSVSYLRRIFIATLLAAAALPPSASAQSDPAAAVSGVWIDDEGRAGIEIKRCSSGVCGTIVWLKDPKQPNGKMLTDQNNPDMSKRSRPICGLQIIGEGSPAEKGAWDGGWVYDPEEGKSYSVELTPKDGKSLQVHGYLGVKALGETMTWTRAPDNLVRCVP